MTLPGPESDVLLLQALVDAFGRLGITVETTNLSFDDVRGKGGLCRVHDKKMIIIDRDLSLRDMIELLAAELARMNTEGLYLPPNVREAVAKYAKRNV